MNDKKLVSDLLTKSLEDLNNKTKDLSQLELVYQPKNGGWSIINCLEHMAVTEKFLLNAIRETIKARSVMPNLNLSKNDASILIKIGDRANKVESSKEFCPSIDNKNRTHLDFLDEIESNRQETINEFNSTQVDLRKKAMPFAFWDKVDLHQMFLVIGSHMVRHTLQIESVLNEIKTN
ncbi:DinB family protein [Psychroserpens algicola]|uniref:DinB family protein n=1 Tax=Psychroserpens algicola TaxID=1719034 RepID=A0ABT0H608_9FLAO|nr:DinB family protein [Psychroserpens algicola]MCK8479796.1 DinB family protein [Psychroserpens algicola]